MPAQSESERGLRALRTAGRPRLQPAPPEEVRAGLPRQRLAAHDRDELRQQRALHTRTISAPANVTRAPRTIPRRDR